jgi:hypothetical protein
MLCLPFKGQAAFLDYLILEDEGIQFFEMLGAIQPMTLSHPTTTPCENLQV